MNVDLSYAFVNYNVIVIRYTVLVSRILFSVGNITLSFPSLAEGLLHLCHDKENAVRILLSRTDQEDQVSIRLSVRLSSRCPFLRTLKKKMESFWPKSWVTRGIKIRPGIPSNWRTFESNWLDIESQIDNLNQIDSILRVKLTIWLSISSQFDSQYQVNLTLNIWSIWLSISSQFDFQYLINLTLNI